MAVIRMKVAIPFNGVDRLHSLSKKIGFKYNIVRKDGGFVGVLLFKDCKEFARVFYEMGARGFDIKV